jgi:DNA-directed RNA polymerase specialized sigma24 family protein
VSAQVEREAAPAPDPEVAAAHVGSLAAIFDAHAAHLFDYCFSLLKADEEAAKATQATLVKALVLLDRLGDPSRLRAWLFALARGECSARESGRAEITRAGQAVRVARADSGSEDGGEPATVRLQFADIEAFGAAPERVMTRAFAALPEPDREVLDLVYRHEISAADLPAVLGISAELARTVLAADVLRVQGAAGSDGSWDSALAQEQEAGAARLSSLPLARLPGSVWPATLAVATDPELQSLRTAVAATAGLLGADGFPAEESPADVPSRKKLMLASGVLCMGLIAPAAAGAGLFAYFSPASHNTHLQVPGYSGIGPIGGVTPGIPSQVAGSSGPPAPSRSHSITSILPGLPGSSNPVTVRKSPKPKPSSKVHPSPSPTTRTGSTSPFPTGSPSSSPTGSPSSSPTGTGSPSPSTSPGSSSTSPAAASPPAVSPSPSLVSILLGILTAIP